MPLYKPPNSQNWYVNIRVNGRPVRRSTGTSSKTEAQRVHDRIIADLWQQKQLKVPAGYTWRDACTSWVDAKPRGDEDRYRLKWINARLGNPALSDLTGDAGREKLSGLLQLKQEEGASAGTLTRYRILLHCVLSHATQRGWLASVPKMPSFGKAVERVRWLSQEEWERLEPLLPPHLRQLARFTLATGLRRHNATHLRWSQVDAKRAVFRIPAGEFKQRKPYGAPLNADALQVLQEQVGQHPTWVFPYQGAPVVQTATKAWRQALAKAEIDDFTWHDLRHTWASWHVMNGTRLEELMDLGGWETLQMVKRYAHLAPHHLAKVAGNVRPISNGMINL